VIVVAAYHVFVCTMFPVQGGMWTAVHTSLHWKQQWLKHVGGIICL